MVSAGSGVVHAYAGIYYIYTEGKGGCSVLVLYCMYSGRKEEKKNE